jgi:hypothetical protein
MLSGPAVLWPDDVAPAPMPAPCTVAIDVNVPVTIVRLGTVEFPFVPEPEPIAAPDSLVRLKIPFKIGPAGTTIEAAIVEKVPA